MTRALTLAWAEANRLRELLNGQMLRSAPNVYVVVLRRGRRAWELAHQLLCQRFPDQDVERVWVERWHSERPVDQPDHHASNWYARGITVSLKFTAVGSSAANWINVIAREDA